ncbi:MAG: hypothetical protein AAFY71_22710 [Bacteroidota bacterium]
MNNIISRTAVILTSVLILALAGCSKVELPEDYFESPIPHEEKTQNESLLRDFRDYRYCELLFSFENGNDTTTEVYVTMGFNDCPTEDWLAINVQDLKDTYGAIDIKANGPRFWIVNKMKNGNEDIGYDKISTFGNLQMNLAAQINGPFEEEQSYEEHIIKRWTTFRFKKNNRIYKLINPSGEEFIMQSYTTMVKADLTIDDLENLGQILNLPDGWKFESEVLEKELEITSLGDAVVIQDEFENTYQRR